MDRTRSENREDSALGVASFREAEAEAARACSFQEEEEVVEVDTCREVHRLEAPSSQEGGSYLVAEVASSSCPAVVPCQEVPSCQEVDDVDHRAYQEVDGLVLATTWSLITATRRATQQIDDQCIEL